MNKLIVLLLLVAARLIAGQQPASSWKLYSWGNNSLYQPAYVPGLNGDVSTFTFPTITKRTAYPAFLTTTADPAVLGDLTGRTVSCSFTLAVTGNPVFRYGGQGVWNNCQVAANVRLFISNNASTYSLSYAGSHEDSYWWSHGGVATISAQTGTVIISDYFDPAHWSNANGHVASDPAHNEAFNAAVRNVRQIGLAYGGGCYFDVGIAVYANTGTADFHMEQFLIQ